MLKLRLALFLPSVHLLASMCLFFWHVVQVRYLTVELWFAINAPILPLFDIAKRIANIQRVRPYVTEEPRPVYYIFLIGGIFLWYFTGRALDEIRRPTSVSRPTYLVGRTLANPFLVIWGVVLSFYALKYFLPSYPGQRHSAEKESADARRSLVLTPDE